MFWRKKREADTAEIGREANLAEIQAMINVLRDRLKEISMVFNINNAYVTLQLTPEVRDLIANQLETELNG